MNDSNRDKHSIESKALEALNYLDDTQKAKVLEYIDSLINLTKINKDGQGSIR